MRWSSVCLSERRTCIAAQERLCSPAALTLPGAIVYTLYFILYIPPAPAEGGAIEERGDAKVDTERPTAVELERRKRHAAR